MSSIVFLFNLVQDVSIIRPLVYLLRRETDHEILFLVSHSFLDRDRQKIWQRELAQMRVDINAKMSLYENVADAFTILQSRRGFLVAASESSLSGHVSTHDVFRVAPQGFVRVTLQHGYECVGFLQNREHNLAHGLNVTFAADVLCGWSEAEVLSSMPLSERSKLYVTGPSAVLQRGGGRTIDTGDGSGIVCENLHSVRLRASGNHGAPFMEVFSQFCQMFREYGLPLTLRPHPGGQYVLRNNVSLLDNVTINNRPIYKADLSSYKFGISAPSTVLLDMLLAGIPTALWHDEGNVMDISNYEGLTAITTLADWLAFARDAVLRRDALIVNQEEFLKRLKMPLDPTYVYRRFAQLFGSGASGPTILTSAAPLPTEPRRVLFIANGFIPTLQLSFLKPLEPLVQSGHVVIETIFETDLSSEFGLDMDSDAAQAWMAARIREFGPTIIVCCRYSGPQEQNITDIAAELNIPIIFHVDDDLLNIPPELGTRKYKAHNRPQRLRTVDHLLGKADLVYCSTTPLKQRFRRLGYANRLVSGAIYCAADVLNAAASRQVRKIGYMGFDHAHDFELVLPHLVEFLHRYETIQFELFGSVPLPDALKIFGDRITVIEPVRDYGAFMETFAGLNWDIGLCPLATTPFNAVKANTKWIEYTSVGAAVIATRGTVYDDCCAETRGILVDSNEWLEALEYLVNNPDARFEMVTRAQDYLRSNHSLDRLREQVLDVFAEAESMTASRAMGGILVGRDAWSFTYFGNPKDASAELEHL